MRTRHAIALTALLVLATPSVALANVGIGVAASGMLLMLIAGNAAVAVVEAIILERLFKAPRWKSFGLLLVANYFSSWLGSFLIYLAVTHLPFDDAMPIASNFNAYIFAMALTVPLSITLEAPFFWACFRLRPRTDEERRTSFINALRHAAWINTATGLAVIAFVAAFASTGIATRLDEHTNTSFITSDPTNDIAWMYFINTSGDVERVRLDGTERSLRHPRLDTATMTWLGVYREGAGTLGVYLTPSRQPAIPIDSGFSHGTVPHNSLDEEWLPAPPTDSAPEFNTTHGPAFWAFPLIMLREADAPALDEPPERLRKPFADRGPWGYDIPARHEIYAATVAELSEHLFVLELAFTRASGPKHIVVVDTNRGLLGHLARGHSPVVVYEPAAHPAPSPTLPPTDATPDDPLLRPDP